MVTKTELMVASSLLRMAADEFSNNVCNSLYLEDTPENQELVRQMQRDEGIDDPEKISRHDGRIISLDWMLMGYLSRRLKDE